MTPIVVLSVLFTSAFCENLKPNFYNGRYSTRHLNFTPNSHKDSVKVFFIEPKKNLTNSSKYSKKIHLKLTTTSTNKPFTTQDDVNKNAYTSHLNQKLLTYTTPYKSGAISNILNSFGAAPIVSNQFGSYQTQIAFENPTATTTTTSIETVTAASLQNETFHLIRQQLLGENEMKSQLNSRPIALVRSASLNTEIYHRPQNQTIKKEQPLPKTLLSTPFQYDQTIIHNNEATVNRNFPFIRKQRNLNVEENSKDFDEKITTNKDRDDNNETQYSKENDESDNSAGDGNDDVDYNDEDDTTKVSAEVLNEQPLDQHEIRYYHDIFLNYPKPHHVNYGHVQYSPELFEQRFESLKEGNRYKGEILWKDDKGGFAQHNWDMALGKL